MFALAKIRLRIKHLYSLLEVAAIMKSLDKNDDAKISKDEAPEDLKLFFDDLDSNKDGFIDEKEAQSIVEEEKKNEKAQPATGKVTAKQMIEYMDKNSDGKISKEEASAELKKSFQYVDSNKDGMIDEKEAQAMADYVNKQNGN